MGNNYSIESTYHCSREQSGESNRNLKQRGVILKTTRINISATTTEGAGGPTHDELKFINRDLRL